MLLIKVSCNPRAVEVLVTWGRLTKLVSNYIVTAVAASAFSQSVSEQHCKT